MSKQIRCDICGKQIKPSVGYRVKPTPFYRLRMPRLYKMHVSYDYDEIMDWTDKRCDICQDCMEMIIATCREAKRQGTAE